MLKNADFKLSLSLLSLSTIKIVNIQWIYTQIQLKFGIRVPQEYTIPMSSQRPTIAHQVYFLQCLTKCALWRCRKVGTNLEVGLYISFSWLYFVLQFKVKICYKTLTLKHFNVFSAHIKLCYKNKIIEFDYCLYLKSFGLIQFR